MVYECPQCKTPLPPGAISCAKCGLQFATPIPSDATLPATDSPPVASYADSITDTGVQGMEGRPARRGLMILAAFCILLFSVAAFAIYTFSQTPGSSSSQSASESLPSTPAASTPATLTPMSSPSVRPASSSVTAITVAPIQLPPGTGGGGSPASGADSALVGRWQAKNFDFYNFNGDGSGSRGNTNDGRPTENFSWIADYNQLIVQARKKEQLAFSSGPGSQTLYLRLPNGRFTYFQRVGNG